jgi:hypothetical protein
MDQQNPGDNWGSGSGSMGGGGTTGTGSSGSGTGTSGSGTGTTGSGTGTTGSTGSGTSYGSGTGGTGGTGGIGGGYNASSGTDTGSCPTCGRANSGGLEQFLGRLGITDDMMNNLKGQFQNVDIDEYLNTARTYLKDGGAYLKDGSGKATAYAKENPGKVAAGVAALALGAGLLYAAVNRDKDA